MESKLNYTVLLDVIVEKVGLYEAAVFGKIRRYEQMKDGYCSAPQPKIASELNISYKTVERAIKKLIEAGLVVDVTPVPYNKKGFTRHYKTNQKALKELLKGTDCESVLNPIEEATTDSQSEGTDSQSESTDCQSMGTDSQSTSTDCESDKETKETINKHINKQLTNNTLNNNVDVEVDESPSPADHPLVAQSKAVAGVRDISSDLNESKYFPATDFQKHISKMCRVSHFDKYDYLIITTFEETHTKEVIEKEQNQINHGDDYRELIDWLRDCDNPY